MPNQHFLVSFSFVLLSSVRRANPFMRGEPRRLAHPRDENRPESAKQTNERTLSQQVRYFYLLPSLLVFCWLVAAHRAIGNLQDRINGVIYRGKNSSLSCRSCRVIFIQSNEWKVNVYNAAGAINNFTRRLVFTLFSLFFFLQTRHMRLLIRVFNSLTR